MFDFFSNWRKSGVEKRQEAISAYVDGELSPDERRRFEQQISSDPSLRAEIEQLQWVKQNLGRLPRVPAPRNFTLDPAVFGKRPPFASYYPVLRAATVMAGFLFIIALSALISIDQFYADEQPNVDQVVSLAAEEPREPETAISEDVISGEQEEPAGEEGITDDGFDTALTEEEQIDEGARTESAAVAAEAPAEEEAAAPVEAPEDVVEEAASEESLERVEEEESEASGAAPPAVPGFQRASPTPSIIPGAESADELASPMAESPILAPSPTLQAPGEISTKAQTITATAIESTVVAAIEVTPTGVIVEVEREESFPPDNLQFVPGIVILLGVVTVFLAIATFWARRGV